MKLVSQVFWKDVHGVSRVRLGYVVRGVILLVMLGAIQLTLMEYRHTQLSSSEIARLGGDLFALIMVVQAVVVALLVPLLTAAVVAGEKERRTLGLLMLSNLKPRQILLDKLLVRLLWLGLLCFTIAPVLLMFLGLGGVTLTQIFQAYLMLLALVLLATALGCLCTVWCQTVVGAALSTYFLMALAWILIAWAWEGLATIVEVATSRNLGYVSPDDAWTALVGVSDTEVVVLLLIGCGLFVLVSIGVSARWLPRLAHHESQGFARRAYSWLHDLFAGQGQLSKVLIRNRPMKRNPLYWRECHRRFTTTNQFCIRASYMTLLFLFVWYVGAILLDSLNLDEVAFFFSWVPPALLPLAAALAGVNGFARDMQRGSWELLLTTPVLPVQVVMTKWLGVMKSLTPAWVLGAVVIVFLFFLGDLDEAAVLLGNSAASLVVIATLGLTWGLVCKNVTRAFVVTLLSLPLILGVSLFLPWWLDQYDTGIGVILMGGLLLAATGHFLGRTEWSIFPVLLVFGVLAVVFVAACSFIGLYDAALYIPMAGALGFFGGYVMGRMVRSLLAMLWLVPLIAGLLAVFAFLYQGVGRWRYYWWPLESFAESHAPYVVLLVTTALLLVFQIRYLTRLWRGDA